MRIPQELVDAIIDCIGADYTKNFVIGRPPHPITHDSKRVKLTSLALASRACNHRARSHLFARCEFVNAGPRAFERFGHCPDVLLGYVRILTVRDKNPTTVLATLRRFISSPLVSIRFCRTCIPEELPEMLKSGFNVHRVAVEDSTLSSITLLNLVSTLERVSELHLLWCRVSATLADDNLPSLPPLQGCLFLSESHPPPSAVTNLLSRTSLPLRSLSHMSPRFPPETELIGACAGTLENLQIQIEDHGVRKPLAPPDPSFTIIKSDFTLDVGLCTKLRQITFCIVHGQGKNAVTPLSGLLSTLRAHRLSNVLMISGRPSSPDPDPQECDPLVLEAWERLDQILYKLGGQAQARGETLTFQSASVVTKETLAELLPRFNQIGICEKIVC